MNRLQTLTWFTLVVLLTLVFFGPGLAAANETRPNILLILSDDHSVPHVGCYGNKDIRTPNLDRIGAQGMRFDRAYVACPQCVPSRAAIMTGRSPVGIQMTRFSAPLPREIITFPEVLRSQGYFTGVAGRTYHLDGSNGKMPASARKLYEDRKLRTFPDRLDFVKTGQPIPQFLEFLDAVPRGKPFFLQLCSPDPHRPLDRNAIPKPHDPSKLTLPAHYPDTVLIREDFARYYDEIGRLDSMIGEVLRILEERGLLDNTIIVFMGDNGASQLRGKGTLYDFGIHVPLLVRWSGHTKGGSSSALISGEDLAPTFLEIAKAKIPGEMTGRSFLKVLRGEPFEGRKYVFAERGAHGSGPPVNTGNFDLGRCIISKTHKLIYNALWQLPYTPVDFANDSFWKELQEMNKNGKLKPEFARLYFSPTRPMFELFDLVKDPSEFNNLIGMKEVAEIENELKEELQNWMILERDYLPLPIPPAKIMKKFPGKKKGL